MQPTEALAVPEAATAGLNAAPKSPYVEVELATLPNLGRTTVLSRVRGSSSPDSEANPPPPPWSPYCRSLRRPPPDKTNINTRACPRVCIPRPAPLIPPQMAQRDRTKHVRNTLNPKWTDEEFLFLLDDPSAQTLRVAVRKRSRAGCSLLGSPGAGARRCSVGARTSSRMGQMLFDSCVGCPAGEGVGPFRVRRHPLPHGGDVHRPRRPRTCAGRMQNQMRSNAAQLQPNCCPLTPPPVCHFTHPDLTPAGEVDDRLWPLHMTLPKSTTVKGVMGTYKVPSFSGDLVRWLGKVFASACLLACLLVCIGRTALASAGRRGLDGGCRASCDFGRCRCLCPPTADRDAGGESAAAGHVAPLPQRAPRSQGRTCAHDPLAPSPLQPPRRRSVPSPTRCCTSHLPSAHLAERRRNRRADSDSESDDDDGDDDDDDGAYDEGATGRGVLLVTVLQGLDFVRPDSISIPADAYVVARLDAGGKPGETHKCGRALPHSCRPPPLVLRAFCVELWPRTDTAVHPFLTGGLLPAAGRGCARGASTRCSTSTSRSSASRRAPS